MIFAFRGIADKDRPVPEPDYTVSVEDVNTDGILQAPPTLVPPNQLRLQVKAFDTVEMTCATFNSYSVTDQQTVVWEIFSLRQRLPYEVSEELWRDVMTSSLIFGLDIEDEPAGPEYREYFNEWLQWLQSSSTQEDLQIISTNKIPSDSWIPNRWVESFLDETRLLLHRATGCSGRRRDLRCTRLSTSNHSTTRPTGFRC